MSLILTLLHYWTKFTAITQDFEKMLE
jgi:hypothetical protein